MNFCSPLLYMQRGRKTDALARRLSVTILGEENRHFPGAKQSLRGAKMITWEAGALQTGHKAQTFQVAFYGVFLGSTNVFVTFSAQVSSCS